MAFLLQIYFLAISANSQNFVTITKVYGKKMMTTKMKIEMMPKTKTMMIMNFRFDNGNESIHDDEYERLNDNDGIDDDEYE